jgi:hypothetical protein
VAVAKSKFFYSSRPLPLDIITETDEKLDTGPVESMSLRPAPGGAVSLKR